MINYLPHNKIDKQKWDECITRSFNGIIYAYSWYLDIVSPKWEALIEDNYLTVMPLTSAKKYGISYLYSPFFTQQLGVFSTNVLSEETVSSFIKHIPKKFKFYDFNLNTFNKLSTQDYPLKSNITCELDLIDSYSNLYHKYSENTKRNIKKASGSELRITNKANIDALIKMFRKNRGSSLKNLKNKQYQLLKSIIERCLARNQAKILGVHTKKNQLCAGVAFIHDKGKIIFLFSATNEEARSNGAMSFLIDHFIKENAQRNLILDFGGSNDPNLARFYKSFGSKECTYLKIKKNVLPWYIRWMKE